MTVDESEMKPAAEWQRLFPDVWILDPDGWRGHDGRPWTDPISREEYLQRRSGGTTNNPVWVDDRANESTKGGGAR